jgi:hypothetical protein
MTPLAIQRLIAAIGLPPVVGFDDGFYVGEPVFNEFILLDAAGDLLMLFLCCLG